MLYAFVGQIIDNMKGLVEIMASSDEIADKAQQMVGRVLEDPEPGRIYRSVIEYITPLCLPCYSCRYFL